MIHQVMPGASSSMRRLCAAAMLEVPVPQNGRLSLSVLTRVAEQPPAYSPRVAQLAARSVRGEQISPLVSQLEMVARRRHWTRDDWRQVRDRCEQLIADGGDTGPFALSVWMLSTRHLIGHLVRVEVAR